MFAKLMNCRCGKTWNSASLLILRLALGLTFLFHGWQKLNGDSAVGFFTQIGIPAAGFFGPLITWLELLGGIALILGFLTHWAAKLLALDMLVALVIVHLGSLDKGLPDGFFVQNGGPEIALLAFGGLLVLMVMGPGCWALKLGHCADGCCVGGTCDTCCKTGICAGGVCKK